jgi:hypothetical protein
MAFMYIIQAFTKGIIMGPTALFDKSFLQSLNPDEAFLFDQFFYSNICPIFTMECMADLEVRKIPKGRTREQELAWIATKFPMMHGVPNTTHIDLYTNELLGKEVPMIGQIITSRGRLEKQKDGNALIIDEEIPEKVAFSRWKNREFHDMDRVFAALWRNILVTLDLGKFKENMNSNGIDATKCRSFAEAKIMAEGAIRGDDDLFAKMDYLLGSRGLNIPRMYQHNIWEHWGNQNFLPLDKFAPYASFVLTIQTFYYISLAASLFSTDQPSSLLDTMYLFYLPFCMVFVSCDRLHQNCAPLFLRDNQLYVDGFELKKDLQKIHQYFLQLPSEIKAKGRMMFASIPPKDGDFLVGSIWDRFLPNWRVNKWGDLPYTQY